MMTHVDVRHPARVATISALMIVAAFVAGKAARDAILLSHFSIRSLPLFIGIAAVLSFPVIVIAGRLMTRFGPARLIRALHVVSAACAIGEWLLIGRAPRVIAVAVFLHLSTVSAVLVSGFWSIVNERFDVHTAKRHIGRIGMGATLGGIFGGVVAERTAVHLAPNMILLVLAGLQLACAGALYTFGRTSRPATVDAPSEPAWTALRHAAQAPLLRNVGLIVVLGAVAAGFVDYVFKADLVIGASHDELLRSLAVFYTVTSVVTAIIQLAACAPIIARLGVPRSVATLPFTVTAFGVLALAVPVPLSAAIARAAELVTRNSVYRSGYELLYAPLPDGRKRATKVVLDVGADKLGDIIGAQLVTLIVFAAVDVRMMLLLAAVITAGLAMLVALQLPRNYTKTLEDSLLVRAAEVAVPDPGAPAQRDPWLSLNGLPSLGSPDVVPLRLRSRASSRDRLIADLRSPDVERVRRALSAPIAPDAAAHVIDLVGREDVGREALAALAKIAPACTGVLAEALLDQRRPAALRRRLPGVLVLGEPKVAAWTLWRSLADPDFDVRYRAGAVLAKLAAEGHLVHVSQDEVFAAVRRELVADPTEWKARQLIDDLVAAAHASTADDHAPSGLEHVFRVLGLALPAEPLRIALHAMQVDDPALRGTAIEYLESILPPDVRAQLWPLLETDDPVVASAVASAAAAAVTVPSVSQPRPTRTRDQLVAELSGAYPAVVSHLKQRKVGS